MITIIAAVLFYIILQIQQACTRMASHDLSKKGSSERESTCSLDCFESELKDLRRFIYSRSVLRLKLYEYTLAEYQTSFRTQQNVALALCLLFMAVEGLDDASQGRRMSEEGRWKEELQKMEQLVGELIKNGQVSKVKLQFFETLNNKAYINNLRSEYLYFFEIESPAIYKKSRIVWRLLQFHSFSSLHLKQTNLAQFEIDHQLELFRLELLKKENEIRLNEHIEQCILSQLPPEVGKDIKTMMKFQTFLPAEKNSKTSTVWQQPKLPTGFTVKQLMLMEINLDTIALVERCEAHECPYMIFCIPFLYLLAETLSYYECHRELFLYSLFVTLISRANKIKNGLNPQLPRAEVDACIIDFLNFRKLTARQLAVKLGQFLTRHAPKMSTFIPVYFQIFSFHAFQKYNFVEGLFGEKGSITERRKRMKEKVQVVFDRCQNYNNERI